MATVRPMGPLRVSTSPSIKSLVAPVMSCQAASVTFAPDRPHEATRRPSRSTRPVRLLATRDVTQSR